MSQDKIWFILNDGQTTGPFEVNEVDSQLSSLKDPQIWGKGQSEWMTPQRWKRSLKEAGLALPTSTDPTEKGLWRWRDLRVEQTALSYKDLLEKLRGMSSYSHIEVMPETAQQWREVFAMPRLVEDLGISRRTAPRVPIMGTLDFEIEAQEYSCRVISISEGGLGLNDAKDLHIGMQFQGILTSASLFIKITSLFEVVYVSNDGYVGLRFVDLPDEFKNSVIEYVNKFATHT